MSQLTLPHMLAAVQILWHAPARNPMLGPLCLLHISQTLDAELPKMALRKIANYLQGA